MKKLKNLTADALESLLVEFEGLKLTKYIAEVCGSMMENRLKTASDICAVVEVRFTLFKVVVR